MNVGALAATLSSAHNSARRASLGGSRERSTGPVNRKFRRSSEKNESGPETPNDGVMTEIERSKRKFRELSYLRTYQEPELEIDDTPSSIRKRIFQVFDEPHTSRLAMGVSIFILVMILISTVSFVVQTLPQFHDGGTVWDILEFVAVMIFTVEYVVRLFTCPRVMPFVLEASNLVDLAAIMPFYLELALSSSGVDITGLAVIRVVRLARVFRLFKLSKYSTGFKLVSESLRRSGDALGLMAFLVILAMVFFSSAVYFAEISYCDWDVDTSEWIYREDHPPQAMAGTATPFQSIPTTMWWALVTISTTGYGGMIPTTPAARFMGGVTMLVGVIVIAFPITVIGSQFSEVWEENKIREGSEDTAEGHLPKEAPIHADKRHASIPVPLLMDGVEAEDLDDVDLGAALRESHAHLALTLVEMEASLEMARTNFVTVSRALRVVNRRLERSHVVASLPCHNCGIEPCKVSLGGISKSAQSKKEQPPVFVGRSTSISESPSVRVTAPAGDDGGREEEEKSPLMGSGLRMQHEMMEVESAESWGGSLNGLNARNSDSMVGKKERKGSSPAILRQSRSTVLASESPGHSPESASSSSSVSSAFSSGDEGEYSS